MSTPSAGMSTCPVCHRHWEVTPDDDCLMPNCDHFGAADVSSANPNRLCQACGLAHAWNCEKVGA